jgi:hypothetical protein
VIATSLTMYFEPKLPPDEIQSAANKHGDHLQEFSEMCRRELESLVKRFSPLTARRPARLPPRRLAQGATANHSLKRLQGRRSPERLHTDHASAPPT